MNNVNDAVNLINISEKLETICSITGELIDGTKKIYVELDLLLNDIKETLKEYKILFQDYNEK